MSIKKKILESIRVNESNRIASDGWLDAVASYYVQDANPLDHIGADLVEQRMTVTFGCNVISKSSDDLHFHKHRVTESIHELLYGDIKRDLCKLAYTVKYGDREGAGKLLDDLLERLD